MAQTRDVVSGAAFVLAGLMTGVAGTLFLSSTRPTSAATPPPPRTVAHVETEATPPATPPGNQDTSAILARLSLLEQQARARAEHTTTLRKAPPDESQLDPLTLEESRQRHLDHHHQLIEAHRSEPVDPSWSRTSRSSLEGQLRTLEATHGFRLHRVDCRSLTCVAELDWDTYEQAREHSTGVVVQPYELNCERAIALDPPEREGVSYRASLVFTCDRSQPPSQP